MRVFCIVAMALLLAACGEAATTTDGGPGQENEPIVVYEMTLGTSEETPPPETIAEASPEPDAEKAPQQSSDVPENGSLVSYGEVVTVERVVDGDTIEVSPAVDNVSEVRLIGVDTPETYGGQEPFGQQASQFTKDSLSGQRVALEFDAERTDSFGRLLAYVYLPGGEMFNETLVEEGYAQVATFPPNVKYVDRFLASQREARQANRGLWGLSEDELCQLAERGNGIGGGCENATPEPESSPEPEPSQESGPGGGRDTSGAE